MKRGHDVMARKKARQRALDRLAYFNWESPMKFILSSADYAERNMLFRFSDRTLKFSKQFFIDATKWFESLKGTQNPKEKIT